MGVASSKMVTKLIAKNVEKANIQTSSLVPKQMNKVMSGVSQSLAADVRQAELIEAQKKQKKSVERQIQYINNSSFSDYSGVPHNLINRDIKGAIEREISPLKKRDDADSIQIEDKFLAQKRISVKNLIQHTEETLLNKHVKQLVPQKIVKVGSTQIPATQRTKNAPILSAGRRRGMGVNQPGSSSGKVHQLNQDDIKPVYSEPVSVKVNRIAREANKDRIKYIDSFLGTRYGAHFLFQQSEFTVQDVRGLFKYLDFDNSNILTDHQIKLVVAWIRHQIFRGRISRQKSQTVVSLLSRCMNHAQQRMFDEESFTHVFCNMLLEVHRLVKPKKVNHQPKFQLTNLHFQSQSRS